ncbi:hypothetical protein SK128_004424 [Halocaridina rubra]|uniref:Uncharacterized protein n=1 Tax=Halocaridina rubra TaxID=373956 RepID=A0AAN8WDZ9_HALRR
MTESVLEIATAGVNSTLSSLSSALHLLITTVVSIVRDEEGQFYSTTQEITDTVYSSWTNFLWWLSLTPLQSHVLKAFVTILCVNVVLIGIAWHVYAKRISYTLTFNSLRIVEDILKKNTSFKLPKEHTPRL